MAKTPVAIVRCDDYNNKHVEDAVRKAFDLVPEILQAIASGSTVLLKPNITAIRPHETAVSTHPSVVRATGKIFAQIGARVQIGESCGNSGWPAWRTIHNRVLDRLKCRMKGMKFGQLSEFYNSLMHISSFPEMQRLSVAGMKSPIITREELGIDTDIDFYDKAGMRAVADDIGAELIYADLEPVRTVVPSSVRFASQVPVWESVHAADRVVSVAKFKTHDHTILTGAIKNFFGIIPTILRSTYHISSCMASMMPRMLVDVFSAITPLPFAVTDAVIGMEGKGPLDGVPRKMGLIIASPDCVAHDAVMAALVGLDPMETPLVKCAHAQGLGQGILENIEIRGEKIVKFRQSDWELWLHDSRLPARERIAQ